ncbi:MAG: hypothetical protein AAF933_09590, partial [Pseudomonadota bacterium]
EAGAVWRTSAGDAQDTIVAASTMIDSALECFPGAAQALVSVYFRGGRDLRRFSQLNGFSP